MIFVGEVEIPLLPLVNGFPYELSWVGSAVELLVYGPRVSVP